MLPFRVGVNTAATADCASSNSDIVFTKSDQNGNLKEFVTISYLGNFVTPRKSYLVYHSAIIGSAAGSGSSQATQMNFFGVGDCWYFLLTFLVFLHPLDVSVR